MKKSIRMENINGSALDKWTLNMNCLYLTIYMTKNAENARGCSESKENDMTYYELFTKAEYLLNRNKITLGEYHKMLQPLNEEVRKEGHWIDHPIVENIGLVDLQGNKMEIVMKVCSECGYEGWETDYCPNCGAKMKGE